ncbi:hypothetical protein [Streptomyces sp. B6B3]|uniref:hypothetical protein n=1 Tax=Streptomyces sp. B6B3 TaxID=3153570 RepID=UPI00325F8491
MTIEQVTREPLPRTADDAACPPVFHWEAWEGIRSQKDTESSVNLRNSLLEDHHLRILR